MQRIRINEWSARVRSDQVEFWYNQDGVPTFIARYFVEDIIEHGGRELQCDTSIPQWTIRDFEMVAFVGWLKGVTK